MSKSDAVGVILVELELAETMTVAGFLAGYCGATRRSTPGSSGCSRAGAGERPGVFRARWARLELFEWWMVETDRHALDGRPATVPPSVGAVAYLILPPRR